VIKPVAVNLFDQCFEANSVHSNGNLLTLNNSDIRGLCPKGRIIICSPPGPESVSSESNLRRTDCVSRTARSGSRDSSSQHTSKAKPEISLWSCSKVILNLVVV